MHLPKKTTTIVTQTPPPEVVRAVGSWDIDPVHSTVQFVVRHAFTRLRGRLATSGASC